MCLCLEKGIVELVTAQRRSEKLKDVEWLLWSGTDMAAGKRWMRGDLAPWKKGKVDQGRLLISSSSIKRRKDWWRSQNRQEKLFPCTNLYKPQGFLAVERSKFYQATGQTTGWKTMTGCWPQRCCLWFRKPLGCRCQRPREVGKASL